MILASGLNINLPLNVLRNFWNKLNFNYLIFKWKREYSEHNTEL
jgi:hypothetical protein